ncbi:MAG: hypothetical protein AAB520_03735 [Patescibacteria group bacterium]
MAKRSANHQSFKLFPHKHPKDRVLLYIAVAVVVGVIIGLVIQGHLGFTSGVVGY